MFGDEQPQAGVRSRNLVGQQLSHAALAQFLRDDAGRGVGIEEAVSDDLAFDLIRAARRGLGSALGRRQARRRVISSSGGTQIEPEGPSSITTFLSMRNMAYRLLWEWAGAERLNAGQTPQNMEKRGGLSQLKYGAIIYGWK